MIHVTTGMAATITIQALAWYADLLSRGLRQFSTADFPATPPRTLHRYIEQVRQGWCDIRLVQRAHDGKPRIYGLPVANQEQSTVASDQCVRDAFVAMWQARSEAQALPAFGGSQYESIRTIHANLSAVDFDRLLLAKLLQRAGSPPPPRNTDGLVEWLSRGISMALRATSAPPGTDPGNRYQSPAGPAQKSAEDLYEEMRPDQEARLARYRASLADEQRRRES